MKLLIQQVYETEEGYWLENGEHRMHITLDDVEGIMYRSSFLKDGGWVWASDEKSRFVKSEMFCLIPEEVLIESDAELKELIFHGKALYNLYETDGQEVYTWQLSLQCQKDDWIRIDLKCNFPKPGRMGGRTGYEPELIFRMGKRPPYDRGHSLWARTELAGYSRFDHLPNNDFPALYYRDPFRQSEILLWFDMEAMSWMSSHNMMRFRDYRMGLRESRKYDHAEFELGLYAVSQSGEKWPKGTNHIAYSLRLRYEPEQTNDRQALRSLIDACSIFIPSIPDMIFKSSWRDLADGAMKNLLHDHCWVKHESGEWLRPYVNNYSPWSAVAAWEGKPTNENIGETPYMIWFQETVLAPLLIASIITDLSSSSKPALNRVLQSSMNYYRKRESVFRDYLASNMTAESTVGTWQYLHAIREYWWIGELTGQNKMKGQAEQEFVQNALPLLEKHAFVPPTLHNPLTLEKVGPSVSFSVLGYVADICMNFYRDSSSEHWLELSRKSLLLLARAPEYGIHQESNQLALAVLAASKWVEAVANQNKTDSIEMISHIEYLTDQAMRQFYWYEEMACSHNAPLARIKGLSTACTPMMYPALWENINNALQFASAYYGSIEPNLILLRFLGYVKEYSKSFFPITLNLQGYTLPYIPIEDIHTLEISDDPTVGQEIYGTGHVVWAYLLFEAYIELQQEVDECLILCLDLQELLTSRISKRRFLFYNTSECNIEIRGAFVNLPDEFMSWTVFQTSHGNNDNNQGHINSFHFELASNEWIKIECNREDVIHD
jgi:hypothetical protein